ncbi:MAG: Calx-beta domain-containing protein [Luteimonas sp.]
MTNRFARQAALGLLVLCGFGAAHAQVVISQVYGGGGNSGAPLNRDYVELFNRGASDASLADLSVQYTSATGTGNFGGNSGLLVALPSATLRPGQYFLVALASGANGVDLPTADASGTINMSGSAGKVALVSGTASLGCNGGSAPCSPGQLARIVDLVGYGSANFFEGAAAAPGLGNTTAGLRADDGCTDSDHNAADFTAAAPAPRNSATALRPCAGGGVPQLAISDASVAEGDSGLRPMFFTISLDRPAGPGGVQVAYETADGTARAGEDYVARSGTASIAEGASSVTIHVDVIGDTTVEADETFMVTLADAAGADLADAQGIGTILNDDFVITPIHAIQGAGATSPLAGQQVATRGIVTARKSNGYFLQSADDEADGDDATSEGIFVFTAGAPPAEAAVGNRVAVRGTVVEFVPSADPNQLPLTELSFATTTLLSTGHPLPTPVVLTVDSARPDGGLDQLERYENMRVTAPSFTVVAPTRGFTSEPNASGTSNGEFGVVVTGVPRPAREPGIRVPDPDPLGSTATAIPRWDYNPETIAVDSDRIGAPIADLAAGCRVVNSSLTGPLDYTFRRYTIYPEGVLDSDCSAAQPRASLLPSEDHATFATYNLERFFDTTNDPSIGEPVLTAAAFERRLAKASLGIRDFMHAPDILGAVEVENLPTLQALADRINADAVAAGQPDPGYVAYLVEGNDVGGIDVGFLARAGEVRAGTPRVQVLDVVQQGKDTTWVFPGTGASSLLNDRPPLLLDAVVNFADGRQLPVTTIVVHQRSLGGIDSEVPAGTSSNGDRVRRKRQQQAVFLAGLIDDLQSADAQRKIVVLGDFNAFEFNDGYADTMGTITGQPSQDDATAVSGDGVDLVEPDLYNLTLSLAPDERYSFVFDNTAQTLDHVLVNNAILASPLVDSMTLSHARINADFPEVARNDAASPSRLSDHDPTVLLLRLQALRFADLSLDASADAPRIAAGGTLAFTVVARNQGPDAADFPGIGFALDVEVADLAAQAPQGWDCDVPTVAGGTTTVACTATGLEADGEALFSISATTPLSASGRDVRLSTAVTSQTEDPAPDNNVAGALVAVDTAADLAVAVSGPTKLPRSNRPTPYLVRVANLGPNNASGTLLTLDTNLQDQRADIQAPQGWNCAVTPGRDFRAQCRPDAGVLADATYADVVLQVVTVGKLDGKQFVLEATIASAANDPDSDNNASQLRVDVGN